MAAGGGVGFFVSSGANKSSPAGSGLGAGAVTVTGGVACIGVGVGAGGVAVGATGAGCCGGVTAAGMDGKDVGGTVCCAPCGTGVLADHCTIWHMPFTQAG